MRKQWILGVLLAASASSSMAGQAPSTHVPAVSGDYLVKQEMLRRDMDFALAPIKNRSDLVWYVNHMPANSPLKLLPDHALRRFLASLEFNETGVTTFEYDDLRGNLRAADIYRVLNLFGVQRVVPLMKGVRVETAEDRAVMKATPNFAAPVNSLRMIDDHEGYRCEGAHTCTEWSGRICMSGC